MSKEDEPAYRFPKRTNPRIELHHEMSNALSALLIHVETLSLAEEHVPDRERIELDAFTQKDIDLARSLVLRVARSFKDLVKMTSGTDLMLISNILERAKIPLVRNARQEGYTLTVNSRAEFTFSEDGALLRLRTVGQRGQAPATE